MPPPDSWHHRHHHRRRHRHDHHYSHRHQAIIPARSNEFETRMKQMTIEMMTKALTRMMTMATMTMTV